MSDTVTVATDFVRSGTPSYTHAPEPARWASGGSMLLNARAGVLANSVFYTASVPPQETVFLTRTQQRIMHRALRRSLRIIA